MHGAGLGRWAAVGSSLKERDEYYRLGHRGVRGVGGGAATRLPALSRVTLPLPLKLNRRDKQVIFK